jgi:alpha-1,6-mannosyltransferase
MSIKTLHITNAYHPTSGGISTFYRALMDGANAARREMVLVVPGEADRLEPYGDFARIYHVQAPFSPWFDKRYRVMFPPLYLKRDGKLRHILQLENPQVVEICDKYSLNYFGGVIRRNWVAGIERPLVVGLTCERMDDNFGAWISKGPLGSWFGRWYMRVIYYRLFDEHIANSEYTAEELIPASSGHQLPRGIHILPMGVDRTRFDLRLRDPQSRAQWLADLNLPSDAKLLLYAGRISPEKNIHLLAQTMEHLDVPQARLLIAGAGPSTESLKAELERAAPGRFSFLGHQDPARLASLCANADLFVHPNPREPFGIAPLEAMACGTPVVAPDRGGVTSYANPSNAWVVPPTGPDFAAAARQALSDELARSIKVERALATADALAWPKVAAKFFQLYDELYESSVARLDKTPEDLWPYSIPAETLELLRSRSARRTRKSSKSHTPAEPRAPR